MKNSSIDGLKVFNFGIPAFRSRGGLATCPMAGACAAGCYAKSGAYAWGNVQDAYEKRLEATQSTTFVEQVSLELNKLLKSKTTKQVVVRIHDSGDFYSVEYYQKWEKIMLAYPQVTFYAYTKMVDMFKRLSLKGLPANFTLIYSLGGRQDAMIKPVDRHSRVFESLDALNAAGYANASHDDMVAALGDSPLIGLVYHGAKSYKNTAWNRVAS